MPYTPLSAHARIRRTSARRSSGQSLERFLRRTARRQPCFFPGVYICSLRILDHKVLAGIPNKAAAPFSPLMRPLV